MWFRHAWMISFAFGILIALASVQYIFLGQTFEPKGTMAAQEAAKVSSELGDTVTAMIRVLGLSYLVWGILIAAISATAFRRGEIWAWYALWASPLFFAGDMIINLSIAGTAWTTDGIFLAIGIGTLLVSPQFESIVSKRQVSLTSGKR